MIKSLLGADEPTEKDKTKPDKYSDTSLTAPFQTPEIIDTPIVTDSEAVPSEVIEQNVLGKVKPFEITEPIGTPKLSEHVKREVNDQEPAIEQYLLELGPANTHDHTVPVFGETVQDGFAVETPEDAEKLNVLPKAFTPDSVDETLRKSGLAWSAAIVLFASVAFMLLFGWFADFAFGTKPWGIVVGIVIGAVIGFVQFFRTTAQILGPPKSEINKIPVYSRVDDDNAERSKLE